MRKYINDGFKVNSIYYHDGKANNDKINKINIDEVWESLSIPYILFYEKLKS